MHALKHLLLLSLVQVAACAGVGDEPEDARDATFGGKADGLGVTEGSPEARGVLRVANELAPEALRDEVGLGSRTVAGIVDVRDGDDDALGTSDDAEITSLAELDAIPYVGPVSLERLLAYAQDHGYVEAWAPWDPAAPPARRCGSGGSATVEGTVTGPYGSVALAPVRAFQYTLPGQGTMIMLANHGAGCEGWANGERLTLVTCEPPAVGTYPVVDQSAYACGGTSALGVVEEGLGADLAVSTGGAITITDDRDGCTTGTFAIDYGPERLTGSFDAYVCPWPWPQ